MYEFGVRQCSAITETDAPPALTVRFARSFVRSLCQLPQFGAFVICVCNTPSTLYSAAQKSLAMRGSCAQCRGAKQSMRCIVSHNPAIQCMAVLSLFYHRIFAAAVVASSEQFLPANCSRAADSSLLWHTVKLWIATAAFSSDTQTLPAEAAPLPPQQS